MIERDRFAFAALKNLMESDGDSEIVHDTAISENADPLDYFADAAYNLGDAMLKRSAKGETKLRITTRRRVKK